MSKLDDLVHRMLRGTIAVQPDFDCPDCGAQAHLRITRKGGEEYVNGTAWCEACELILEICSITYHPRYEGLRGKNVLVAIKPRLAAVCVSQAFCRAGFDVSIPGEDEPEDIELIIADAPSAGEGNRRWVSRYPSAKVLVLTGHGNRVDRLGKSLPDDSLMEPVDFDWIGQSLVRNAKKWMGIESA